MRFSFMVALAFLISAPAWVQIVGAQSPPGATTASLPAADAATTTVAEQADPAAPAEGRLYRLPGKFTFRADITEVR